jgi:iron complex transport system substrate-binding protein
MIEMVDALNGISKKGSQSKVISIDEIEEFKPDKIVIMPCGFDIERTEIEAKTILNNNKRWQSLEAVKMDEIYIVDANSYFSKPSPRVITGIEIIAKIVYPLIFKELDVPLNSFRKLTQ